VDVRHRESFLCDPTKLKGHPIYERFVDLAFKVLPNLNGIREVPEVKPMTGHRQRCRIHLSSYRIGVHIDGSVVDVVRVMDRRGFYRFFP
jgi:mRNA-degrading endonuclease RelE of RelBE toxin-antitoxin system